MSAKPKILFLIADGMGDWPVDSLGGKTPLQAARTPTMDAMAAQGAVGLCRTVPEGMPPGSDVANMALLGYDPARFHTGRGPIEAAAQGLELADNDLVWRLNLLAVSAFARDGTMLDYSAGHIDSESAKRIILDIRSRLRDWGIDESFDMIPGVQYRHLLVQRGGAGSSEAAFSIRPPHDITNQPIAQDWDVYAGSPRLSKLLGRAAERLAQADNPTKATSLWPWGQGRALKLPSFQETFGLKGAVVSAVDLVRGLGRAASMDVLEVEGVTGLLDTNYEGKVQATLDYLRASGDYVFLHVEAPDECGHAGDVRDKIEAIERFDARVVAPLRRELAGQPVLFLIACDHLTPVAIRTHAPDPVPFLLWRADDAAPAAGLRPAAFGETEAAATGLVLDEGHDLLAWMLAR